MTRLATQVPEAMAGMRLDQVLAELFADYSRSKLQTWVKAGRVKVNGQTLKSRDKLDGGEVIELDSEAEIVIDCTPENIALDIVFEDEAVLIVNKPAGLVVHPAAGNWSGTLQNALLSHHPDLAALPRAGIVHRLDKDTSGLLMVAKTLQAHNSLVTQLQERSVHREYLAITKGRIIAGGTVDEPIGRHPSDRKRFAVRSAGKPAVTHYRVVERFSRHTLVRVKLETGRTHQIRVHMAHIHWPLVGDPIYGGRFQMPPACSEKLEQALRSFKRQALHAEKLGITHPVSGDYCEWEQALPDDMADLVTALQENDRQ
ncbi:MAG: 23S rRNA pseudouridine(1911/1915/1917) synthase RluD [Gammaproteobacteria bacterium HGW-Gammaproteobacteria-3]|nr:MAG: 23S rRNA pseudouridine(1911/1915/1917) synthase RluD [Gammaproteobacteria bacterium HGW-Gammaproteobacteria-3]